ncbi:MAG: enoyl-CoA hydratase-related protein [Pseudomonadota bacterium]
MATALDYNVDEFSDIQFTIDGSIATITLNRPEALNALTPVMLREINAALDQVAEDGSVRALVFTGAGRAFCAGADLKRGRQDADFGVDRFLVAASEVCTRIEAFPVPSIAALNGLALAGGLELTLACDLVVASETAKIGDAHVNYGMMPAAGASVRLPRKVGYPRAKYMMLTGAMVPVTDLLECGFVSQIVPPDALGGAVQEVAEELSRKSPLGLRLMKQLIDDGTDQPLSTALSNELLVHERYRLSKDYAEGLLAFEEKRPPQFTGD